MSDDDGFVPVVKAKCPCAFWLVSEVTLGQPCRGCGQPIRKRPLWAEKWRLGQELRLSDFDDDVQVRED